MPRGYEYDELPRFFDPDRFDSRTLRGEVFAVPGQVWLRAADDFLRQIDPETFALVQDIRSPEVGSGSVTVGFGSVWASVADDRAGSVFRLRL